MSLWLNAVMPVLRDKRPNPWIVVAKEYGIFGTSHDQTVELDKLFAADFAAAVAKIGGREVRSAPVKCEVGPDSKRDIGCQGHDPVQDAWVVRLLDGNREVARKKWVIGKVVRSIYRYL